jgi:hypothetical protein
MEEELAEKEIKPFRKDDELTYSSEGKNSKRMKSDSPRRKSNSPGRITN